MSGIMLTLGWPGCSIPASSRARDSMFADFVVVSGACVLRNRVTPGTHPSIVEALSSTHPALFRVRKRTACKYFASPSPVPDVQGWKSNRCPLRFLILETNSLLVLASFRSVPLCWLNSCDSIRPARRREFAASRSAISAFSRAFAALAKALAPFLSAVAARCCVSLLISASNTRTIPSAREMKYSLMPSPITPETTNSSPNVAAMVNQSDFSFSGGWL